MIEIISGRRGTNFGSRPGAAAVVLACGLAAALVMDTAAAAQSRSTRFHDKKTETKKEPQVPTGPLHIAISIGTQRVALYANGALVARSAVSTGQRGFPTPTGVFSIIEKQKWHRSNIYSGAPMPYMQRITWSGVALHEGSLPGYPASHGCIRLTPDFARFLWSATKKGARVVVANEEIAPAEFAHPRLPTKVKANPITPPSENTAAATETQSAPGEAAVAVTKVAETSIASVEVNLRSAALEANAVAMAAIAAQAKAEAARRKGPVAIFISRKTSKLYVRQGFEPLFEMPVTIAEPNKPIGTHVFTVMQRDEGADIRWTAASMPPEPVKVDRKRSNPEISSRGRKNEPPRQLAEFVPTSTAAEALDRVELPLEAVDLVSHLLMPGASLIVSDHGLGEETGEGTDFIVVTRS
ncbi:MAG: L,D-transpeptidase [Rhizobiales bacterium]|nr:L,D-transpeptidase [Hyphomicrobiales bacterium]